MGRLGLAILRGAELELDRAVAGTAVVGFAAVHRLVVPEHAAVALAVTEPEQQRDRPDDLGLAADRVPGRADVEVPAVGAIGPRPGTAAEPLGERRDRIGL